MRTGRTRCWVPDMTDAQISRQFSHVPGSEDILGQTIALPQKDLVALSGGDSCRILTAMLQHSQGVVNPSVDRFDTSDSSDSAHSGPLRLGEVPG